MTAPGKFIAFFALATIVIAIHFTITFTAIGEFLNEHRHDSALKVFAILFGLALIKAVEQAANTWPDRLAKALPNIGRKLGERARQNRPRQ